MPERSTPGDRRVDGVPVQGVPEPGGGGLVRWGRSACGHHGGRGCAPAMPAKELANRVVDLSKSGALNSQVVAARVSLRHPANQQAPVIL